MANAEALFAKWQQLWEREQSVYCPYCAQKQDVTECPDLVTYHGESGALEFECQVCERLFYVTETVLRTYTCRVAREGES